MFECKVILVSGSPSHTHFIEWWHEVSTFHDLTFSKMTANFVEKVSKGLQRERKICNPWLFLALFHFTHCGPMAGYNNHVFTGKV